MNEELTIEELVCVPLLNAVAQFQTEVTQGKIQDLCPWMVPATLAQQRQSLTGLPRQLFLW